MSCRPSPGPGRPLPAAGAAENIVAWTAAAIARVEQAAHAVGWDEIESVDYLWGTKHLVLRRSETGEAKSTTELDAELADHIALHGPAVVLRRCARDRKLLELHRPVILRGGGGAKYFETTTVCRSCEPPQQFPEQAYPCPTLRAVAEDYGWTEG